MLPPRRTSLTLRTAVTADAAALARLVESAYRGNASRAGWTTEADLLDGPRTSTAEVTAILADPDGRFVVAEAAGRLVGCCQLEARPPGSAYLGMLAVEPARQGQGVGRAVVDEAERVARREWSAERLSMQVLRQRGDLLPWYGRLGFRPTGDTAPFPYDVPGTGPLRDDLEFVVLEKPIA